MEYVNVINIVTAIIVLLMLNCLRKLFFGDIGRNKAFYVLGFVSLGVALYVWRSGAAAGFIRHIMGVVN